MLLALVDGAALSMMAQCSHDAPALALRCAHMKPRAAPDFPIVLRLCRVTSLRCTRLCGPYCLTVWIKKTLCFFRKPGKTKKNVFFMILKKNLVFLKFTFLGFFESCTLYISLVFSFNSSDSISYCSFIVSGGPWVPLPPWSPQGPLSISALVAEGSPLSRGFQ